MSMLTFLISYMHIILSFSVNLLLRYINPVSSKTHPINLSLFLLSIIPIFSPPIPPIQRIFWKWYYCYCSISLYLAGSIFVSYFPFPIQPWLPVEYFTMPVLNGWLSGGMLNKVHLN